MLDLRQAPEYAKYMEAIGWVVERKDGVNYYIKKIPLLGSFIKAQRPENINYQHIDVLAVKHRAFQIIIEPKHTDHRTLLTEHGFRQSRNPYLPSKTIHIDLTKSENQLLKEMHYKTRYNIKLGKKLKVKVESSKDILSFADFWQECALKQRGMFLSQKKEIIELYNAFGKKADLVFVFLDKQSSIQGHAELISASKKILNRVQDDKDDKKELLSGILMIRTKDIAYYMYAASTQKGKKLFSPTLNAWEAIKLAKKLGCKIFEFEGIYDERFPLKGWKGFTRFKRSFGGREVEYPGAMTKFRIPYF